MKAVAAATCERPAAGGGGGGGAAAARLKASRSRSRWSAIREASCAVAVSSSTTEV